MDNLPTRYPLAARRAAAGLFALALAVVAALPALAEPAPAQLDADERADLARIERYLNDIDTMRSRFVQISEQGVAEGEMYIDRPGDMRIEYDPPVPVLMVASGSFVMYHDSKLKQTSHIPVRETPVAFLLDDEISLAGGLTVTRFARDRQTIEVTVVETEAPARGEVTLTFDDQPLRLAKWRVIDAQGTTVDVALVDPRFGMALDSDLFSTLDPNFGNR